MKKSTILGANMNSICHTKIEARNAIKAMKLVVKKSERKWINKPKAKVNPRNGMIFVYGRVELL